MKEFFKRHLPASSYSSWVLAGFGGFLAIGATGWLSISTGTMLLMAPFGASCVLLFSVPQSPLSQPANVIGGHFLAAAIGLAVQSLMPDQWWAVALAVGLSISAMAALRLTHPPAGANPLVVFASTPDISFLIFPVLFGSIILVGTATFYHRLRRVQYPIKSG